MGRVAIGVLFLVVRWCVLGAIITVAGAVGLLDVVTSGILPTRRGSSVGAGVTLLFCMAVSCFVNPFMIFAIALLGNFCNDSINSFLTSTTCCSGVNVGIIQC